MSRLLRLALPLALLLPSGCKPQGPFTFAAVSGRVWMDNRPLAHAVVRFQPIHREDGAPGSYGETDDDGYFTLRPVQDRYAGVEGAVVGPHRVQISLLDRTHLAPKRGAGQLIPARYNAATILTFTTPPEGTRDAVFRLDSTPAPGVDR